MTYTQDGTIAPRKKLFLEAYARYGVIGPSAKEAGISRDAYYEWREADEAFDIACDQAKEDAVDAGEAELRKRGVEGREDLILYKGEPVWMRTPNGDYALDDDFNRIPFTRLVYSDRLLEVYVRTHRPQYKEKTEVTLMGPDGQPLAQPDIQVTYVLPEGMNAVDYDQPKQIEHADTSVDEDVEEAEVIEDWER